MCYGSFLKKTLVKTLNDIWFIYNMNNNSDDGQDKNNENKVIKTKCVKNEFICIYNYNEIMIQIII